MKLSYKTLVLSKSECSTPIWSPNSKPQMNQLEKVKRMAARWTCRSVGDMLDSLEWPSLGPVGTDLFAYLH